MLELVGLKKSYGTHEVLKDITFSVQPGRMTGFVGGNGAGKTTTMRIALGVLASGGGDVRFNGRPITQADRRSFGYMPEERGLYPKMKVREQIAYLARLHGATKPEAVAAATELLERLGLGERLDDNVETLSLGNQQRAQIAAALVHHPPVLILDEPFSGLDPIAVEVVAGVLQERAAAGAAILFSSHQLDLVERLCDDLVITAGGTIRAAGPRAQLREEYSESEYVLSTTGDTGWLQDEPGVEVIEFAAGRALFRIGSEEDAQRVLRTALSKGPVTSFTPQQVSLSEIFKEVVQ